MLSCGWSNLLTGHEWSEAFWIFWRVTGRAFRFRSIWQCLSLADSGSVIQSGCFVPAAIAPIAFQAYPYCRTINQQVYTRRHPVMVSLLEEQQKSPGFRGNRSKSKASSICSQLSIHFCLHEHRTDLILNLRFTNWSLERDRKSDSPSLSTARPDGEYSWIEEIELLLMDVDSMEVELIPGDQVMQRIRSFIVK